MSVEFREPSTERPHLKQENQSYIPVGEYVIQIHISFRVALPPLDILSGPAAAHAGLYRFVFAAIDGLNLRVFLACLNVSGFLLHLSVFLW